MVRTALLGLAFIVLGGIGSWAAPPSPDLAGVYKCAGKNPDGTAYEGFVEIRKLENTFRVRWTLQDSAITGVGIYSGGVFAVSYFGGAPAVVVYKVDGEQLVGEWTMGGVEGTMYTETLTKTTEAVPNRQQQQQQPRAPRGTPGEHPTRPLSPASGGLQV